MTGTELPGRRFSGQDAPPLRVAMLVVDGNEVSGAAHRDPAASSPVVHVAIANLIEGMRGRSDIELDILYGKNGPDAGHVRQEQNLRYWPVPYRIWPIPGMGGAYMGRTLALRRAVESFAPDLVHAQGTERESGMVAAFCSMPSLLTLHGNFRELAKVMQPKPFDYYWINARLERLAVARIRGFVALSSHTEKSLRNRNRPIFNIPNAVAAEMFSFPIERTNPPRIVCIGDIGPGKNQLTVVKAAQIVQARHPEAVFEFYGSCNSASTYSREFLTAIASATNCNFCGRVDPRGMAQVLSAASVSILLSLAENCPMAVIEAMAAGVPVVASTIRPIAELISPGQNGLLVEALDAAAAADAIIRLLDSHSMTESISEEARAFARANFSPSAVAEAHVRAYRSLLNRESA